MPPPAPSESIYPSAIHGSSDPLDSILGPNSDPTTATSTSHNAIQSSLKGKPRHGKVQTEEDLLGPRPFGMSRIEWRAGREMKDWEIQKFALRNKLNGEVWSSSSSSSSQNLPQDQDQAQVESNSDASLNPWKPRKILSREAQDGIRLLNSSDPKTFDTQSLSLKFGISKESIRRILRSQSEPEWMKKGQKSRNKGSSSSSLEEEETLEKEEGIRERQNRRANERLEERREELKRLARNQSTIIDQKVDQKGLLGLGRQVRGQESQVQVQVDRSIREEVEFERITKMIQDEIQLSGATSLGSDLVHNFDSDSSQMRSGTLSNHNQNHSDNDKNLQSQSQSSSGSVAGKPVNQIFYEGLLDSSSTSTSTDKRKSSSLKSSKARGQGDWCLIDAGWCIVHVMTAEARAKWDLERNWENKVVQAHKEFERLKAIRMDEPE